MSSDFIVINRKDLTPIQDRALRDFMGLYNINATVVPGVLAQSGRGGAISKDAITRENYPELFKVLNEWAAQKPAGHEFKLPDLRGMFGTPDGIVEEPLCETMDRPKSRCGCPDCGSSLIQYNEQEQQP